MRPVPPGPPTVGDRPPPAGPSREDLARAADRQRLSSARAGGKRWRLLLLYLGPGVLAMLGENDGPSMLSYAASGAEYGIGFFLPFILVTFVAAVFVQQLGSKVGLVTHRGFGELIFQRFGRFWGWVSSGDVLFTNVVTLIAEIVAIRVGLSYFGVLAWVAVVGVLVLVASASLLGTFDRWENVALGLAAFNLLFVAAAVFSHPSVTGTAHAFATWTPLPRGSFVSFLLVVSSDIGATVTPWMLFFQQSATADKGLTSADARGGLMDTALGGAVAVVTGCGALLAAVPLFVHHVTVTAEGGAGYAAALRPLVGHVGPALFSLGLVEAGALAVMTISASTAYAIGEVVPGGAHSFNDAPSASRTFHLANIGVAAIAGVVVLIPGAPLLAIALNANLLATVLMPAGLVFLLLLARDEEIMKDATISRLTTGIGVAITAVVTLAGGGYAVVAFVQSLR